MSTATRKPAYRAFTVVKREGQDDFWIPIGAAFAHDKSDGYNVVLQALPIPNSDGICKIVLRPPKDDDERQSSEADARNNKSGTRRR